MMIVLCSAMAGCGDNVPDQKPIELPPVQPLTVDGWKQLPVAEKYDERTFERLRLQDPRLKDQKAWDKFMTDVIVPERKKDIPD